MRDRKREELKVECDRSSKGKGDSKEKCICVVH